MVEMISDTCIRVCSELNDWIDCIFIVDKMDAGKAVGILKQAFDDFWNQSDDCYGDWLEGHLEESGIQYEAFYKSSCLDETEEE